MSADNVMLIVKIADDHFKVYEYSASVGIPDLDLVKEKDAFESLEDAMLFATECHAEHGVEYKDMVAENRKQQEHDQSVDLILETLASAGIAIIVTKSHRDYILRTTYASVKITIEPTNNQG